MNPEKFVLIGDIIHGIGAIFFRWYKYVLLSQIYRNISRQSYSKRRFL